MRRISLKDITDNMILAKPIYQGTQLILDKNADHLSRYVQRLNNIGIFSIYVEDKISEDIEIPDAVCEQTRTRCVAALYSTFHSLEHQGCFTINEINKSIEQLIEEIFSQKDILVCLSQISTIEDGTLIHCINTTVYCLMIANKMGLSKEEQKLLAQGAILHDVGKIRLDESILLKAAALTKDEYEHIKDHPTLGFEILSHNDSVTEEAKIITLQHHERLNGSGYPKGLKGEEIHPFAQITAVADVYDALTTERCYRKSMSNQSAYQILNEDAQSGKINASMLSMLLSQIAVYPNGIVVQLSDGTHGIVKCQNIAFPMRPVIRVIDDYHVKGQVSIYDLDLSACLDVSIVD